MESENEKKDLNPTENIDLDIPKRKNPINFILIGLIVVMIALLAVQMLKMNDTTKTYDELLSGEDNQVTATEPDTIKLDTSLFDSDVIKLDFSDITLGIENEDIRSYYNSLFDDLSNFTQVYDKTFMPADNVFEMRFVSDTDVEDIKITTSVYFFNKTNGNNSYCSIAHNGVIIGTYLIPSEYYGNLYNIVWSSEGVTEHSKELLKTDIADLIEHEKQVAIHLDESHTVLDNVIHLETFESLVKNKENATMMYALSNNTYVIISYMNFKYYVFVTDANGEILQEGDYKHYTMWENNVLYCYNTSVTESAENLLLDGDGLTLKVVK